MAKKVPQRFYRWWKSGGSTKADASSNGHHVKQEHAEKDHHCDAKRSEHTKKRSKRRTFWIWTGAVTIVAFALVFQKGLEDSPLNINGVFNTPILEHVPLDWLPTVSPALEALNMTFNQLISQIPALNGMSMTTEAAGRPGLLLHSKGYRAKHPVVIVPGFVTSQLELWEGHPCAKNYFRQRMWGTLSMMQTLLRNTECYLEHIMLDPATGLDPAGIKIRAALGLEAVDYFVQGYWVWGRLVEALADIGYDSNNLVSAAYDWRLAIPLMEVRDGYFSRLSFYLVAALVLTCYHAVLRPRGTVEQLHQLSGEKVVLTSHSYGEAVARSFITWVDRSQPGWVEEHLEAHISIAGPILGVPKAITAVLSGEMRDTAQLGALAGYLTNNILPRESRAKLFRTWASLLAMAPVGGTKIWGNSSWAPDDTPKLRSAGRTYGAFMSVTPVDRRLITEGEVNGSKVDPANDSLAATLRNWFITGNSSSKHTDQGQLEFFDVEEAMKAALEAGGSMLPQHFLLWGAVSPKDFDKAEAAMADLLPSIKGSKQEKQSVTHERRKDSITPPAVLFPDATTVPLPNAPSFKMYCLYGVGIPSERSYHYLEPESWQRQPPGADGGSDSSSSGRPYVSARVKGETARQYAERVQRLRGSGCGANTTMCTSSARHEGSANATQSREGEGSESCEGQHGDMTRAPGNSTYPSQEDLLGTFEWRLNTAISEPETGLENGIQLSDGDTTVPLISLGLMCRKGWRSKRLNPAGMRIVSKEFKHVQVSMLVDARGGPHTAHHVDILGNEGVLSDVLKVASGHGDEVQDEIYSEIDEIAKNVDFEVEKPTVIQADDLPDGPTIAPNPPSDEHAASGKAAAAPHDAAQASENSHATAQGAQPSAAAAAAPEGPVPGSCSAAAAVAEACSNKAAMAA